ncbi:hypothetical protein GQ53DRAFT_791393 [Thozetella sp. PMI_491]|nr:hypothetical protein GQ53DRAFT_791393 [Thozetella sp. PMI_491]
MYPKPYPGIPYNLHSTNSLTGDLPDLVPAIKAANGYSTAIFSITNGKLREPIAQLLFPALRKPLITLEDPREIKDILLRRNREFDKASIHTTPELKAQQRLWADVMNKATLDLIELWRLKASFVCRDQTFHQPGLARYEIRKLQSQVAGDKEYEKLPQPRGAFMKKEVNCIADIVARNANSTVPGWFKRVVHTQIEPVKGRAVDRVQRLELGKLEAEEGDTCMMDLVLRRLVLEAKKGKQPWAVVVIEILEFRIPKGAEIFMNYHLDHTPYIVDESRRSASSRMDSRMDCTTLQSQPLRLPAKTVAHQEEKTGKEVFNPFALPSLAFE